MSSQFLSMIGIWPHQPQKTNFLFLIQRRQWLPSSMSVTFVRNRLDNCFNSFFSTFFQIIYLLLILSRSLRCTLYLLLQLFYFWLRFLPFLLQNFYLYSRCSLLYSHLFDLGIQLFILFFVLFKQSHRDA